MKNMIITILFSFLMMPQIYAMEAAETDEEFYAKQRKENVALAKHMSENGYAVLAAVEYMYPENGSKRENADKALCMLRWKTGWVVPRGLANDQQSQQLTAQQQKAKEEFEDGASAIAVAEKQLPHIKSSVTSFIGTVMSVNIDGPGRIVGEYIFGPYVLSTPQVASAEHPESQENKSSEE